MASIASAEDKSKNRRQIVCKGKKQLDKHGIKRYSRQLLLPQLGIAGQEKINQGKVLIVGAGGLGCPAAMYLAAAGVGTIGIIDYDVVELENLHRQVLHRETKLGIPKSASAAQAIEDKPLVSGSALRFEGQLTLYNYEGGPCYRCLFPTPPPPETVTNCSDGGVLGIVPGIIGLNQGMEAIKILTGIKPAYSQRMLLFDAMNGSYHTFKLRNRRQDCVVCGDNPTICELQDYEQFCRASATDKIKHIQLLEDHERVTVDAYKQLYEEGHSHLLLDVREEVEFSICRLPQAINLPLSQLEKKVEELVAAVNIVRKNEDLDCLVPFPVYIVCHHGNDSQKAVKMLKEMKEFSLQHQLTYKDVKGGLDDWSKIVDNEFPEY